MKFLIITHVKHKLNSKSISAYEPYISEMNIWLKHLDEVQIIAPKTSKSRGVIDLHYKHDNIHFSKIPAIEFTSSNKSFISFLKIPLILTSLYKACRKADHIHLRCPGNIGLLGVLVQIIFPKKPKTAKYAGNWDPKAKQPWSYRLQKWILSNTFLTKNMQVLVYGHWENQTRNIKPFFTATYYKSEIEPVEKSDYSDVLNFVFVGTLVEGKRPLFAIKIIEALYQKGYRVTLELYGDGLLRGLLQDYITKKQLHKIIQLKGNQSKDIIKLAYKKAHFSILASKSEGWPKAIAESMFFGVIPIATSVSCVPYMLDYGKRGILIKPTLQQALDKIISHLNNLNQLKSMRLAAQKWSQNYTMDMFEEEIKKLLY